jgi:hypothetical protein
MPPWVIGLIGVVVGFVLHQMTELLKARRFVRTLQEVLEDELNTNLFQLDQKMALVHHMHEVLSEEAWLPDTSTNRAMTLFTSLGPSADCRGRTQATKYQVRTGHTRGAAFSVSQCGFWLSWALQGKVARTPHQSKGSDGTVCQYPLCVHGV